MINDPNAVFCYGEPLVSGGIFNRDAINGYGLVTNGFLWQMYDIWIDLQFCASLSTSWSNTDSSITTSWSDSDSVISTSWSDSDSVISTSWSNTDSAISTTWTSPQFGTPGEYLP